MDKDQLKAAGLKITTPRLKILELLAQSETQHLSAEDIYTQLSQADENLSLATIYRVLTQFESAGLVIRHNFEEGYSVFELNQGEHHDHIVCSKCRKVIEFHDEIIEARQLEIAKKYGFEMTDHSLNIYGICTDCK